MSSTFTLRHRTMWFLCWMAYRIVIAMPGPDDLKSRYGRLYLCKFFYRSDAEQAAAWDRHLAVASNVRALGSAEGAEALK